MNKIHLYFLTEPPGDRFIKGDRFLIRLIKRLFFPDKRVSGVKKVFINLCKGFDKLEVDYDVNLCSKKIKPGEPVVVLGSGRYALKNYSAPNKIIAGIALMTHPSEWPDLFDKYPVVAYLQHSEWANDIYAAFYGTDKCAIWPAGIDTEKWSPDSGGPKQIDILIYNKIRWNKQETYDSLARPIKTRLEQLGLKYAEIVYGNYGESEYFELLNKSKAMLFLCEHESQGFACCEAMAMNVPVFAWDQGYCLDPNRFAWNAPVIPATSVPFFDAQCGIRFKDLEEFNQHITRFWSDVVHGKFRPRDFVVENISLEKSGLRMLDIINRVYN